jgi:hypothetical protein
MDLLRFIADRWSMVLRSPEVFVLGLIAGAAATFFYARHSYIRQIATLEAHNELLKSASATRAHGPITGGGISQLYRADFDEQAERRLIRELTRHKGMSVRLRVLGGELARRCTERLRRVFERAGWRVTITPYDVIGYVSNVYLHVKDSEHPAPVTAAIIRSFFAAGFDISIVEWRGMDEAEVEDYIIVGEAEPI